MPFFSFCEGRAAGEAIDFITATLIGESNNKVIKGGKGPFAHRWINVHRRTNPVEAEAAIDIASVMCPNHGVPTQDFDNLTELVDRTTFSSGSMNTASPNRIVT